MIDDIRAIVWKERKSLFRFRGSRTRFLLIVASPLVLVFYAAWDMGAGLADDFLAVIIAIFIPAILVTTAIPDSFAGERERRTLSTLLASRLPDAAILYGKLAIAVAYSWGLTLALLLVGLIVASIAESVRHQATIVFYSLRIGSASVTLSLFIAVLVSAAGVLISLRARTVQEAAQILTALTILPPMLLGVLLTLLLPRISGWLDNLNWDRVLIIALIVLLVADFSLIRLAAARFHRSRLIAP